MPLEVGVFIWIASRTAVERRSMRPARSTFGVRFPGHISLEKHRGPPCRSSLTLWISGRTDFKYQFAGPVVIGNYRQTLPAAPPNMTTCRYWAKNPTNGSIRKLIF